MRFNVGEMVFHRLEIRYKATNIVEIESIRGSIKTPTVVSRGAIRPGDICGLSLDGNSEAGFLVAIF